jgi:hypothetical protein
VTIRTPSRLRVAGLPPAPRPWRVITAAGRRTTTHDVMAATMAAAILSALELAPPRSRLVRCTLNADVW